MIMTAYTTELQHLSTTIFIPLIVAVCCGMVLGLEREISHKSAGLRTQVLITLGSTMFVLAGDAYGFEPARVAANIITGLGFLGGGVILQYKGAIRGMTTASIIWVNGSIGLAIGVGHYFLAACGVFFALLSLRLLGRVEYLINRKCQIVQYSVNTSSNDQVLEIVKEALKDCHFEEESLTFHRRGEGLNYKFAFCNPPEFHEQFINKLQSTPGVISVHTNG